MRRVTGCAVAAMIALTAWACGDDDTTTATQSSSTTSAVAAIDPGDGGDYHPDIDPADFVDTVSNPFLPLLPGSRWTYRAVNDEGDVETIEVTVLDERRTVMGVSTVVVRDVVSIDDEVIEDTFDWFAQDRDGNVWYFGEDTTEYADGKPDTSGSWEAGIDGALPGIVMPAEPTVTGTGYRQEYLPGEAEDMGEVIATSGSVSTEFGTFDDVIVTRDWTPLEPDVVEEKTYARGVGMVHESKTSGESETVELVEFVAG